MTLPAAGRRVDGEASPVEMTGEAPGRRISHEFSGRPGGPIAFKDSRDEMSSIELSALVVSAIITLVLGECWHWVPVIAASLVVHVQWRR